MKRYFRIWRSVIAVMMFVTIPAVCLAAESAKQPLTILLHVEITAPNGRDVPKFSLTIMNGSSLPGRVVDLNKLKDLNDILAVIDITAVGHDYEVLYYLSDRDPGELNDSDYVIIEPSEKIIFALTPPIFVDELPPGKYKAHGRYSPDPYEPVSYLIPAVEFTIK